MTKQVKESNIMRPQAGRQALFINLKDDGVDDKGVAIGKGKDVDFIFYGGGKNHCLPIAVM